MAELVASSWTHDVDSNPVDGMNGAPLAAAVASSALPRASSSVFRQDFSPGFPPHPNSPERAARRTSVTGDALERVKSMIGRVDTGKSSTRPLHLKKPGLRRWSFTGTSSTINNNNNKLGEGAKQLKRGNESSRHTCVGRRNNSNAAESGRRARDQGPQAHESTPSIIVSCGERSLKGRKDRSKANEDDFFAIEDIFAYRGVPGLVSRLRRPADLEGGMVGAFGVFDGHGGRSCSAYVARNLPCAIANSPAWSTLNTCGDSSVCTGKDEPAQEFIDDETNSMEPQRLQEAMIQAMLDGFRRVQDEFAEFARRIGKTSGSTAVVALVCGRRVVVGNLGDSVAMFCDDTAAHGEAHTFLTKCHNESNPAEKERVEAAGGTFAKGRLFGRLQPTRGFGDPDIRGLKENVLIATPEIQTHHLRPTVGSAFLVLGSDGLWGSLPHSKVMSIVQTEERRQSRRKQGGNKSAQRIAEALALEAAKRGDGDDVTAVVVVFS